MGHRIVIDATPARFGGTAYAIVTLATGLAARDDVDQVCVVARRGSIVGRGLHDNTGVGLVELPAVARGELIHRTAWQAARLQGVLVATRATALVTPGGLLPRRPSVPVFSWLLNPVAFEDGGIGNRVRRAAIRRTNRYARVMVPSTHMQRLVGGDAAIVAPGVDPKRLVPAPDLGTDVLCVADFYPHKGHTVLVDAWSLLEEPRPRLRFIGNPDIDPEYAATVRARVRKLRDDRVTVDHHLRFAEVVDAYRSARLLVLPSTRESFGMPVAEAAMCGVPALLRDAGALRATGGAGAEYLTGGDPRAWAAAIQRIFSDPVREARLRAAALDHAQAFTVSRTVDGVLAQLAAAT